MNGHWEEQLPPPRAIPPFIQFLRNLLQGVPLFLQQAPEPGGLLVLQVLPGVGLPHVPALLDGRRRQVRRRAQLRPARLFGGEGVFGPFGYGFPLVLGDNGKQAHGERIGIGHVAADEGHAGVAQGEDEPRVPRQSVQLGNQQRRPYPSRLGDGREQLGPPVFLAALHLDVFGEQLRRVLDEGAHGGLLGFEAEARLSLAGSADAEVRDVAGSGWRHTLEGVVAKVAVITLIKRPFNKRYNCLLAHFGSGYQRTL